MLLNYHVLQNPLEQFYATTKILVIPSMLPVTYLTIFDFF
jgi:hypothetical protein